MSKPWISREAKDALRKALAEHEHETHQLNAPDDYQAGAASTARVALDLLDSLPVLDAGEGEAALEMIGLLAHQAALDLVPEEGDPTPDDVENRIATVRHALRAAKAREPIPCPKCGFYYVVPPKEETRGDDAPGR